MDPLLGAAALVAPAPAARHGGDDAYAGKVRAAKELETLLFTQLLASMRKTVPDAGLLPKSAERDVFEGTFDASVAETLTARDPLGLVRQIAGPPPDAAAAYGGALKVRDPSADRDGGNPLPPGQRGRRAGKP
jgi:Rod binding domain-containing protein